MRMHAWVLEGCARSGCVGVTSFLARIICNVYTIKKDTVQVQKSTIGEDLCTMRDTKLLPAAPLQLDLPWSDGGKQGKRRKGPRTGGEDEDKTRCGEHRRRTKRVAQRCIGQGLLRTMHGPLSTWCCGTAADSCATCCSQAHLLRRWRADGGHAAPDGAAQSVPHPRHRPGGHAVPRWVGKAFVGQRLWSAAVSIGSTGSRAWHYS